jgi:hypothetical protein
MDDEARIDCMNVHRPSAGTVGQCAAIMWGKP